MICTAVTTPLRMRPENRHPGRGRASESTRHRVQDQDCAGPLRSATQPNQQNPQSGGRVFGIDRIAEPRILQVPDAQLHRRVPVRSRALHEVKQPRWTHPHRGGNPPERRLTDRPPECSAYILEARGGVARSVGSSAARPQVKVVHAGSHDPTLQRNTSSEHGQHQHTPPAR